MTLRNACHAAIAHGNMLADINADRWAQTYHCTPEDVRATWEEVLSEGAEPPLHIEISKRVDDE